MLEDCSIITTIPGGNGSSSAIPNAERVSKQVNDLISNSLNSSRSGGKSSAFNHFLRAIKAAEDSITELAAITNDPELASDAKSMRKFKKVTDELNKRWTTIRKMHDHLVSTDLENYDSSTYYDFADRLRPLLEGIEALIGENNEEQSTMSWAAMAREHQQSIKVQQIAKIDNDFTKWQHFRELSFEMTNKQDLSNMEKLTLEKRYRNQRQVVKSTLTKLLAMEPAREDCSQSLKRVHDEFHRYRCELDKAIANVLDFKNIMMHELLLSKIDAESHQKYEQQLNGVMQLPGLDDLMQQHC